MVSLTENKSKVLDFLIRNFHRKNTIRMLAKQLNLSPMGAQKILKEFERERILVNEKIGTGIFYSIDLNNDVAFKLAGFILTQNKLISYAKVYARDLEKLKENVKTCVLFGSVLTKGENARDIDVLVIIDEKNFKEVEKEKKEIEKIATKPLHFMYQTKKDFENNIKKGDKPLLDVIRTGAVLWGQNLFLRGIKNAIRK
jgi:predicted nucleotidyltransferase